MLYERSFAGRKGNPFFPDELDDVHDVNVVNDVLDEISVKKRGERREE